MIKSFSSYEGDLIPNWSTPVCDEGLVVAPQKDIIFSLHVPCTGSFEGRTASEFKSYQSDHHGRLFSSYRNLEACQLTY